MGSQKFPDLPVQIGGVHPSGILAVNDFNGIKDFDNTLTRLRGNEKNRCEVEKFHLIFDFFNVFPYGAVVLFNQIPFIDDDDAGRPIFQGQPGTRQSKGNKKRQPS